MKNRFIIALLLVSSHIYIYCNNSSENTSSWTSPSYYFNTLKSSYAYLAWPFAQIRAIKNKMSEGQIIEKKWGTQFQHKEGDSSDSPITNPVTSVKKFKQALKEAAKKDPQRIMGRFNNNTESFLLGASSSSYQVEGGLDRYDGNKLITSNATARYYDSQNPKMAVAGDAIDFWNRYEGDIDQMKKELGINAFRLSIAWDRIYPNKKTIDSAACKKYLDIIKKLKNSNIEPIIVLHHYTVPTWFEDLGGFEKQDNIKYFVDFATTMYNTLGDDVTYWSTFNAVEGYAFKGYWTLDGSPGKKKSMYITQQVMANMLEAHVQVYQAINGKGNLYKDKETHNPNTPKPLIGIQKNIVLLDPYEDKYTKALSAVTSVTGEGLQNKGFFDFFTTGIFNVYTQEIGLYGPKNVYNVNKLAPQSIDWIGINIYSNMLMQKTTPQPEQDTDKQTDNLNYRDYPEGIYRAVEVINKRIAKPLSLPIIITENGIATDIDDKRTRFFRRTLYTIRKCIEEGYPIIGYTPWASHDNYEWPNKNQPEPFNSRRYGFFYVDFNKKSPTYLNRTLKKGAEYYRDFLQEFFNTNQYEPIISDSKTYDYTPLEK